MIKSKKSDSALRDLLVEGGLRCTPMRLDILKILDAVREPINIVTLQEKCKNKAPNTATLYRMMQDFERVGIIRRIDLRQKHVLYEITTRSDHHHIVCTVCGAIEDIVECDLERMIKHAIKKSTHFSTSVDHVFEIYALCKKCV